MSTFEAPVHRLAAQALQLDEIHARPICASLRQNSELTFMDGTEITMAVHEVLINENTDKDVTKTIMDNVLKANIRKTIVDSDPEVLL